MKYSQLSSEFFEDIDKYNFLFIIPPRQNGTGSQIFLVTDDKVSTKPR